MTTMTDTTTTTGLTWEQMRTTPITAEDIERARRAGACAVALDWARAAPRTWGEAPPKWVGWYGRHAATAAQVDACIEGTTPEWRGEIGAYRADLTAAQLDACIAGTTPEGRGLIGAYRAGLTAAQRAACGVRLM